MARQKVTMAQAQAFYRKGKTRHIRRDDAVRDLLTANALKYGYGSTHRAHHPNRCRAMSKASGKRCQNLAPRINVAHRIFYCHFHCDRFAPWRVKHQADKLDGKYRFSGWRRNKQRKRVTRQYLEQLEEQSRLSWLALSRDRRESFLVLYRRCQHKFSERLDLLTDNGAIAAGFIMKKVICDHLSPDSMFTSPPVIFDRVEAAIFLDVGLPAHAPTKQSKRERARLKAERAWARWKKQNLLGLPEEASTA